MPGELKSLLSLAQFVLGQERHGKAAASHISLQVLSSFHHLGNLHLFYFSSISLTNVDLELFLPLHHLPSFLRVIGKEMKYCCLWTSRKPFLSEQWGWPWRCNSHGEGKQWYIQVQHWHRPALGAAFSGHPWLWIPSTETWYCSSTLKMLCICKQGQKLPLFVIQTVASWVGYANIEAGRALI